MPVSPAQLRAMVKRLPSTAEGPCYGTPGFRVKGKLIARLWEDNRTLVVKIDRTERELLIEAEPDVYFVTDHYRGYDWVLVNLSKVKSADLVRMIENAWRSVAPKRLIRELEGAAR
jgi:hypothetical protein